MAKSIGSFFKLPESVELARESKIVFEMREHRVHHEGLEFMLGDLHVRTSGYVGFDQNIDLLAELIVRLPAGQANEKRWLSALDGKSLRIPIGGTLRRPVPDWRRALALNAGANLPALLELARQVSGDASGEASELLGRLTQPSDGSSSAAGQVSEAAVAALERLMELRRQRLEAERAAEASAAPGAASEPSPRRRLLGRALDRLLEGSAPADPNVPSSVSAPPAPKPNETAPAPSADGASPTPNP